MRGSRTTSVPELDLVYSHAHVGRELDYRLGSCLTLTLTHYVPRSIRVAESRRSSGSRERLKSWDMLLVKLLALLSIPRRLNGFSYQHTNQKRIPHKKKTSVRWTIQSLEKLLAVDGERGGPFTYKRKADASLIDALYLLLRSNNTNDTLDCEKRIEVLMRTSSFPLQVTERVLKITSVAGLEPLATDLLQRACAACELVSPQAYTALMNCLRRQGKLEKMEEVLLNLASVCRRTNDEIDIVAFNTYVSAICEAAVSSKTDSTSEQFLLKALNLLKSDTTKTSFCLKQDLDHYSFNPLLGAVAKLASPSNGQSTKTLLLATMKRMRSLGLNADDYAHNARLRATIGCDGDDAAFAMFQDIFSRRPLDGYSIGLVIAPLMRMGRTEELISLMRDFYDDNALSDGKMVTSAFESYFASLVELGEIGLARDLFERFFLREHSSTSCERVEVLVLHYDEPLRPTRKMFNILLSGYSTLRKNATAKRGSSHGKEDQILQPSSHEIDDAFYLFNSMIESGVQVDSYTTSAMMTLCQHSEEPQQVTKLLRTIENNMSYDFSPAAYRSIIAAYARTKEPSSSITIWEEMCESRPNVLKNRDTWNTLLGALLQKGDYSTINMTDSSAAARNAAASNNAAADGILSSMLNGLEPYDAADRIIGTMRNRTAVLQNCRAPMPNSQSYCIVASILAESNIPSKSHVALELFRIAMDENCPADGRCKSPRFCVSLLHTAPTNFSCDRNHAVINAVLRCFGDDLEGALEAWKCQLGAAAASHERRGSAVNRLAAYNGLMYTAGKSYVFS